MVLNRVFYGLKCSNTSEIYMNITKTIKETQNVFILSSEYTFN